MNQTAGHIKSLTFGGVTLNIEESPKLLQFPLWEPWIFAHHFEVIYPLVIETFQSGPDRHCHPQSHAARVAKNSVWQDSSGTGQIWPGAEFCIGIHRLLNCLVAIKWFFPQCSLQIQFLITQNIAHSHQLMYLLQVQMSPNRSHGMTQSIWSEGRCQW